MDRLFGVCFTATLLLFTFNNAFSQDSVTWYINNIDTIGGLPVTLYGSPVVVEDDGVRWAEFDGVEDGMLINSNPLAGATEFTVEIVFRPLSGGDYEQRFLHMQQDNDNRLLMELRSVSNNRWSLDTYIKSGSSGKALLDTSTFKHDNDKWYHAALVYADNTMKDYVNGKLELTGQVEYTPVDSGATSLGVRQNLVSWYKGDIRYVKVTPKALEPSEFFIPEEIDTIIPEDLDTVASAINTTKNAITCNGICPNPASQVAFLELILEQQANLTVDIFSVNGQKNTLVDNQIVNSGYNKIPFNIAAYDDGLYCLLINVDQYCFPRKLVINR